MSKDRGTLFNNATVIDGSGETPRYKACVFVQDGRIASITPTNAQGHPTKSLDLKEGTRIVDASNLVLTPGFIDMHAHSDLSVLHTPDHLAKVTQGVTTEVVGQDGISYSPVDDTAMARIRQQIAGWNGNPTDPPDFFYRWRSVGEYLDVLDREKIATNIAFLVPQGNLRILVKGWDSSPATPEELEKMKTILRKSLEEGAVGMSSGLTYVPGNFASDAEIAELCKVVAEYEGYYCPHTRSYGKGALKAYSEMIDIARKTSVRLHLTHATMNYEENAGRADELISMIDAAIADGVDITLDTYPYLPGSTTLASTLPSWAASASDPQALLSDPDQLAKIKHEALVLGTDGCHGVTLHWPILEIGGVQNPELKHIVGKTIQQIADESHRDPFDTYVDILKKDNLNTTILSHCGHEGNVRTIMRHPKHTGSTDGILTSTKPHPRGWGTFPRYLGHYARDLPRGKSRDIYHATSSDVFVDETPETIFEGGLEEAVAHVTSRAAAVVRVKDRGLIKEGYRADLVLFDEEGIRDAATYAEPRQPAKGIVTVMINGEFVVDQGRPTRARAGKTVRWGRDGVQ
ncbi:D-aminoacylase [Bimuria novae-zelandiae CBS 107.79]|uniref:D-aminoacylase n=1 Tax=Bimuria novae-zelandiae CBS 107.79 TaxID=1447943 RepID=A0A6A5UTW4_9PLEO|nr:D-aminoacylase [Bimuria novae-zelandiae CBS 107.79]